MSYIVTWNKYCIGHTCTKTLFGVYQKLTFYWAFRISQGNPRKWLPSDPGKSKHTVYEFIRLHSALTEKRELLGSFPDWIRKSDFSVRTCADLDQHTKYPQMPNLISSRQSDSSFPVPFTSQGADFRNRNTICGVQKATVPAEILVRLPRGSPSDILNTGHLPSSEAIWCFYRARNVCPRQLAECPLAKSNGEENDKGHIRMGE